MVSQVIKYLTYAILQQSWKTSVLYWSYSRGGGCNQLQVHLPHLYLSCSLWTCIRLALTLESITNNSPTHSPSIPHHTHLHSFSLEQWEEWKCTHETRFCSRTLEFLFFRPKLLYGMLVIGPKDTTIALKKKTIHEIIAVSVLIQGRKVHMASYTLSDCVMRASLCVWL